MAGTLTISTLSDGTNSTSATNLVRAPCVAWVNFNGTGTVAIRASYNVSSITDNGTGNYTINFTTALTDTNYSVAGTATYDTSGWGTVEVAGSSSILTMTTTALNIRTIGYTTFFDPVLVCVNIFR